MTTETLEIIRFGFTVGLYVRGGACELFLLLEQCLSSAQKTFFGVVLHGKRTLKNILVLSKQVGATKIA